VTLLPEPFCEPRDADRLAESAALACLDACCQTLGLAAIQVPVPIETWIEHPLGIDFGFEAMTDVAGYAVLGQGRIRVADLLCHDELRLRWTIAHELGHLLLHKPEPNALRPDHPEYRHVYSNDRERQAERFAAAFLIPIGPMVATLLEVCNHERVRSEEALFSASRDTSDSARIWNDLFLPAICNRFRVTRAGAIFRVGELRLEDGAPFMLPKVLVALSA
jgi:hypothetical protein